MPDTLHVDHRRVKVSGTDRIDVMLDLDDDGAAAPGERKRDGGIDQAGRVVGSSPR